MRLPDGTILMHEHAPYDPVKAHAYYIRTRQLKGRKKGAPKPQATFTPTRKQHFTVKLANGATVRLTEQQLNEQKAYAASRVANIKAKLSLLNTELKKLMAAAEAKKKAQQPQTAAEKAKAAKKAKQYRQSHQQQIKSKAKAAPKKPAAPAKPQADPVAELQQKITQIKSSLTAAVAKQRELLSATKSG